jgi:hypothetical protein
MTKEDRKQRDKLLTKEQDLRRRERLLSARLLETPLGSPPPPPPPSLLKRMRHAAGWVWGVIAGVATLSSLYIFWPDLKVSPDGLLDPKNPFTVMFKVENTGFVPVSNLRFYCDIDDLYVDYAEQLNFWLPPHQVRVLGKKQATTTPCTIQAKGVQGEAHADFETVVVYSSWVPRYHHQLRQRFVGTPGTDGTWHWLQQPAVDHRSK